MRVNHHTKSVCTNDKHSIIKDKHKYDDDDHGLIVISSDQNQCQSSIQREITNLDTLREDKSPKLTEIKRNLNLDLKHLSNNTI